MPILVEAGWGGVVQWPWSITWTDITNRLDVIQGVAITRGASDELSETQPGGCTMTLDNQDGALTPGNPNSPYAPWVRRNTPIRVSALVYPARTGAGPWPLSQLTDAFDDGRTDPTLWSASGGTVETAQGLLRLPLVPGVVSRYTSTRQWKLGGSSFTLKLAKVPALAGSSVASVSLYLHSATSGTRFRWYYHAATAELRALNEVGSADGAAVAIPYSPIDHAWVRIRETGGQVLWETSRDGWDWTVRRSITTPAWVGSDLVQVELAASRTGGTSDPCELGYLGALVRPRFYGTVNEWPVSWSGLASSVSISATDLFKRLNRLPALRTCLVEEIVSSEPIAYYPLTEATGSTAAGDLSGTTAGPLTVAQVGAGGTLDLGTAAGPAAATEALPLLTPASATAGKVLASDLGQGFQDASSRGWLQLECWFQTSVPGRVIFGMSGAGGMSQQVWSLSASGALQAESGWDGFLSVSTVASGNLADGAWHHFVYDEVLQRVWVDGVLKASTPVTLATELRQLTVGGYAGARLWAGSIGHLALYAVPYSAPIGAALATHYAAGMTAHSGETADLRVARLARYAGVSSVTILGSTHDPVAGQGEAGSSVVARLREVEATDSGRLYAERDYLGLAYQSRDLRYNPDAADETFVIAYADLETTQVELADDDQKLVNSIVATRPGGATQKVVAKDSILAFGLYEQDMTLLKTSDNSVVDAAYWRISRYGNPQPELREVPVEAFTMPTYLDILDADISSYFTVYDLPEQAPTLEMRVTVEGYSETIAENSHKIQFRTSAAATDSVWVLGDPVYGQLDYTTRLAY
ncbi:hypothetical protein ACFV2V_13910 [Streptomyces sp. NPDC059698]|uniref:hypothetical protein n=1 Tax=unclassified Streptomyces TaxID=2593676 RepID=UPI00093FF012|nr:hypothetical protein [Streptomyces sp. CB02366]OKJ38274.1 hypothetical protein AMK24_11540 [Streptomyces sp. CB02366]